MPVNIFDLDFSRSDVIILSLVPALINIGIYVYLVFNFNKTRTILFFSSFVLLIGLWQASEGFMRMSKNPEAAESWYRISLILLLAAMPFGIEFVLRLMKNAQKIKANFLSPILFVVPIVLFIFIQGGLEKHIIIPSESWYWIANPVPNLYTYLLLFWIAFNGLLMLLLLWLHYTNNKTNELIKKQVFLLLIGLAGPVIIGVTVEIFLPAIFKMNDIPITTPLVTVFSICALITISKYNIFDYSPKHQWESIIANLNDAILIVNNDDKVMYANDSFCQLLGYEF